MEAQHENPGPVCRCGRGIDHPGVEATPSYGFWAWFMLLNGASATPKKITYRCRRCGEVIATTRDPRMLRAFR